MTSGQIIFGLSLVVFMGVSAYFGTRSPRKPFFDQYRESPMFQPQGRAASAAIAIVFAAFAALLYFGIER